MALQEYLVIVLRIAITSIIICNIIFSFNTEDTTQFKNSYTFFLFISLKDRLSLLKNASRISLNLYGIRRLCQIFSYIQEKQHIPPHLLMT